MPEKSMNIKSQGSFVSAEKIKENIETQRIAAEANQVPDAEKSKMEADEKKRIEDIDALLPKRVLSSFGEVSYEMFKAAYKTIWDQIREKDHLALGYCSFSGDILPGVKGVMRSLRSRETRGMLQWAPASDANLGAVEASEELRYRYLKLVVGLVEFDGKPLAEMPELSPTTADKWLDLEIVKQKLAWIDSLPEEVTIQLSGLQLDVSAAMRFALRENLKNLLALPARS